MKRTVKTVGFAALISSFALLGPGAALAGGGGKDLAPDKGLSLDISGKHTMSYFEANADGCGLTVVMAAVEGGMAGTDTPGTRISVTVQPGKSLRIDAAQSKSAEFACDASGKSMSARLFDREPYKPANP